MSADQHENVPVENKIPEEEEEEEDKGTSRLEIVKDFCRYMDVIQGPGVGVRASPLHGLILFGKLQSFAMESRSVLEDALVSFNPINYLRKEYRAQDWRKASGFYDEVKQWCTIYLKCRIHAHAFFLFLWWCFSINYLEVN